MNMGTTHIKFEASGEHAQEIADQVRALIQDKDIVVLTEQRAGDVVIIEARLRAEAPEGVSTSTIRTDRVPLRPEDFKIGAPLTEELFDVLFPNKRRTTKYRGQFTDDEAQTVTVNLTMNDILKRANRPGNAGAKPMRRHQR